MPALPGPIPADEKEPQLPRIECEKCGKPFGTQWAEKPEDKALPRGAVVSERFELGRNFANKLWNAARFSLINLEGFTPGPVADKDLLLEDRWLLSRLATVTQQVTDSPGALPLRRRGPHALRFCLERILQLLRRDDQGPVRRGRTAADGPACAGPCARYAAAAAAPDDAVS